MLLQVVTVKNKYMLLNDTGLAIEYKQRGTPDPRVAVYGVGQRFAGTVPPGGCVPVHWDNVMLDKQLMIRPLGPHWCVPGLVIIIIIIIIIICSTIPA
jgi:hypothetical protein